jgi:hypothetical protein
MNRYVGNLAPMPGVFPDYPAPAVRSVGDSEEMVLMRWGMPSGSFRQWTPHDHQHPRQIDPIALSTAASSRSMAGLVPSSGPFMGPSPTPDDESAVPNELVPGAAALVPKAPPVTDM